MQAIWMYIDMIFRRNMKLHRSLIISKKEMFNMLHFRPIRTSIDPTYTNMLPTFTRGGQHLHVRSVGWRWDVKEAIGIISRVTKQLDYSGAPVSVDI
jgi:hypothetical protein|uniref:Uncharacterized protein n=1 Tax=uncultured marine virus TaxID=186617 RepID=A0A0F7L8A5_9VIRU|nr:hypothetical protein VVA0884 [uncultured marine virus]